MISFSKYGTHVNGCNSTSSTILKNGDSRIIPAGGLSMNNDHFSD